MIVSRGGLHLGHSLFVLDGYKDAGKRFPGRVRGSLQHLVRLPEAVYAAATEREGGNVGRGQYLGVLFESLQRFVLVLAQDERTRAACTHIRVSSPSVPRI